MTVSAQLREFPLIVRAKPETGGILLGAYRGSDIEITGMTRPGPSDDRRLFSFDRVDPVHQSEADLAWAASDSTVTFIGDWHTHPHGRTEPSSIDIQSWRSQARQHKRLMVFLLFVPGEWAMFVVRPRMVGASRTRLRCFETGKVGTVFT